MRIARVAIMMAVVFVLVALLVWRFQSEHGDRARSLASTPYGASGQMPSCQPFGVLPELGISTDYGLAEWTAKVRLASNRWMTEAQVTSLLGKPDIVLGQLDAVQTAEHAPQGTAAALGYIYDSWTTAGREAHIFLDSRGRVLGSETHVVLINYALP